MVASQCPRFNSCNAAVCPLDANWQQAQHLPGEKVCFYLLASGKEGAVERFADDPAFAAVAEKAAAVCFKWPSIAAKVQSAASAGFRGAHFSRSREKTYTDMGTMAAAGLGGRPEAVVPTTATPLGAQT